MKFNYKYTLFSDNQILGKPYISINMTTATDDEYNKIGTKLVFKIDEIINVIEVGNHIQCQSQHYFLVNDYKSRISSEIANLNEALENSCRILLEQSTKYIIKLAGPSFIINNRTTSHEIEDDFSGQPEPGNYSGPAKPESISGTESNSGTGETKPSIFNRNRSFLEIPYSCLSEKLVTLVDSVSFIPEHCVPKVRKAFIRLMKEIVASPQDSLAWKSSYSSPPSYSLISSKIAKLF